MICRYERTIFKSSDGFCIFLYVTEDQTVPMEARRNNYQSSKKIHFSAIGHHLPETERKILSLVANRLLCATGEKHLYETVKAELSCGGYTFAASGKSVLKNGWKDFEDAFKRSFKTTEDKEQEEKKLPELQTRPSCPRLA